ncbi:transposase family protein [Streptomyces sp. A0642]|uniref:transposase family protein n=1 Tax=Streptomyces sp. A0642 TaxID=2563100 RepID=UPI001F10E553|nr:transposase family protein [Streptomyces sp. A0642]
MDFSMLCDLGKPVPADASSPLSPTFDQIRLHPQALFREVPGLLERLAAVPDPRDARGVRPSLVAMLALTACAVTAGAKSLLAVRHLREPAPIRMKPDFVAALPLVLHGSSGAGDVDLIRCTRGQVQPFVNQPLA